MTPKMSQEPFKRSPGTYQNHCKTNNRLQNGRLRRKYGGIGWNFKIASEIWLRERGHQFRPQDTSNSKMLNNMHVECRPTCQQNFQCNICISIFASAYLQTNGGNIHGILYTTSDEFRPKYAQLPVQNFG